MSPRDRPPFRADHVRTVVQMQRDGELRRASWHMDFIYQLDGVAKAPGDLKVQFHNAEGDIDVTPKLTIPSPSMVHYRGGRAAIDERLYPDLDAFWADLTAAYAEEVRRLGAAGCTYLQFDDTSLAYLNDPVQRQHVVDIGGDGEHQHEAYIKHINEALAGRPEGMAVTTHMCRGNFRSSWVAEGGYDFVAEALFNELDVDGFFMEWDDARSGGFEPLRFVPKGKLVVLGLVTTKRGALVEGNALTSEQEVAKLRRVVEVAEVVWGT